MAPEVAVPANFGKHHLKSRTHNNLELLCAEGEVQRANSMILSLNSSVIEDLIARLEITSLDMQDFAAPAVNCFVESMYCGELENCDKTNFRDLNKIGHVFDVTWFVERCLNYFTELVDEVTGRCYEDILFVTEEAWFVEENLKKCELMNMVMKKMEGIGNRKSVFLKQYAADLDKVPINQLRMVVKIAGSDVGILAAILANHLKTKGASSFSDPGRYLFQNIDFVRCFSNIRYSNITHFVVTKILNDSVSEDFKCAVKCISNFAQPKEPVKSTMTDIIQCPVILDLVIENFLKLDWNCLCDFLSRSDKISNLYQFFDALNMWLHIFRGDQAETPRIDFSDENYVKDICDITQDRCWGKISEQYLNLVTPDEIGIDLLVESFSKSDDLSCEKGSIFISKQSYTVSELFDVDDLKIPLVLEGEDKVPACIQESECCIVLKRIHSMGHYGRDKHFFFEVLLQDENIEDENADCHYHNDLLNKSEISFSILMEIVSDCKSVTPLPFNCKPCKDVNGNWYWGYHRFCGNKKTLCQIPCKFSLDHSIDDRINIFVVLST